MKIIIGNRDKGISKSMKCLTNFFSFHGEISGFPLNGREVDTVHVDFIRILDLDLAYKPYS